MKQIRIPYGNDITLEVDIFRMLADGTTESINPEDIEGLEMRAVKSLDYSKHNLHAYVSEGKTYASIDGLTEGVYDVQLSGKIGGADISACEARSLALTYDNRDAYGGKLRQLRITEGNDFQLTLQLRDIDGKTIDASELTDVSVVLKNPTVCRYKTLTPVIAGTDVVCDVQELPCGVYDIELTASHSGRNIRSCEHCAIAIFYDSPSASALPAYSFEMPVAPSLVYCGCALSEDSQKVAMQFAVVGGGVAPEIIEELRADIAALQAKDAEHDAKFAQYDSELVALDAISQRLADTEGEIKDVETKHNEDIEFLTSDIEAYRLNNEKRLFSLENSFTFSMEVNRTSDSTDVNLLQANTPTSIRIKATIKIDRNITFIPDYLEISRGQTVLVSTKRGNTLSLTTTQTMQDGEIQTFTGLAKYANRTWSESVSITARHLIVYGMGNSAEDVIQRKPGTALALSAAGRSYKGTVASDVSGTQKMYILVPDNVTLPTSFKVNTFAAEYKKGEKITVDGITYTPYASGGNYAAGKSITVVT